MTNEDEILWLYLWHKTELESAEQETHKTKETRDRIEGLKALVKEYKKKLDAIENTKNN